MMADIQGKKIGMTIRAAFISLVALLCLQTHAHAQTGLSAGVRGTVTFGANGAAVVGARVVVASESLRVRRETTTDAEGRFAVHGLAPGTDYEVSVSADDMRVETRRELTLTTGEAATIPFTLELQGVAETVTVSEAADSLLSQTPEVGQVVGSRQLRELPSNGRSVNRFALLDPHVRNTGALGADGSTSARLSINANSYRHTFYALDGNSNYETIFANAPQQQVSISSVQEFKVLTNQYSAEYGGSSAGIVSTVTKSGTGDFHGEGFFFLRPSGIQAAPPVSSLRVPNELTQFGGALGGPLWSSRATFFASYERSRQNRGAFIQSPQPRTFVGHFRDHIGLARFDYQASPTHSSSLRLNGNRNANDNPNDRVSGFVQPSAAQTSVSQGVGAQFTDRQTWGALAGVVNELRVSYVNSIPSQSAAVVPQTSVVRTNYSTEGGSNFSWVRAQTWQVADQLIYSRGRHMLRVGGDYARQKVKDFSYSAFGEYRFPARRANQTIDDYLLNQRPTDFTQKFGVGFIRYGQTLASGFVQDTWRVTSRLTADLGLRYEYQSITDDRNNFAPRLGFAYDVGGHGKTIIRGGAGVFYDQYYMYITRRFLLEGINSPTQSYRINSGADGFPTFPGSLNAPPAGARQLPRDYVYLPGERLLNPYNMQFSLGVQRQLFANWKATLDLVHSRTLRQMRVNDINAPAPFLRTAPGQTRTVAQADRTRPFGTRYMGVDTKKVAVIENTASSNYDSLDLGLVRRFGDRFQFEAHYLYASALTTSMFFGEADTGVPENFRLDEKIERAPSDFHQRQRFVAHGLVELPLNMQLSFVATLASGLPVNPLAGDDTNGDGYRQDRPYGFARNSFRTPAQQSLDLSLAKRFTLREETRLELRAEAFNLTNHANYIRLNNIYGNAAAPDANFLKPLAGVSNVDPGRQIQFGVRLVF